MDVRQVGAKLMGMRREFAVTCDNCDGVHYNPQQYADDAKEVAANDGWQVSAGTNNATCPDCREP